MVATITRTRRKLFIIAVVITAMLGAIPVVALAHNVTVPGGQDWTYLGYHYHNIGLAGFQFYGTVAQWTRENNNLSVRGLYQCFNLSGQHCSRWEMSFNRVMMQTDEANGWPRWRTISTFAHEIGHMIGLDHITSNTANLMFVPWTQRTTSFPGSGDIRGLNTIWP